MLIFWLDLISLTAERQPDLLDPLYFFPGLFCWLFFSCLLIYGGLGVGVFRLESWIVSLELGFSVDVVWGLRCGAFWVFWGLSSLYKHRRITLEKNSALDPDDDHTCLLIEPWLKQGVLPGWSDSRVLAGKYAEASPFFQFVQYLLKKLYSVIRSAYLMLLVNVT